MVQSLSKKIIYYSAFLVTMAVCMPRLLIWQNGESGFGLIPFNIYEWCIQFASSFIFCLLILSINKKYFKLFNAKASYANHSKLVYINIIILFLFAIEGGIISRCFVQSKIYPFNGYFLRLATTHFLLLVELKILAAIDIVQQKELENNELRHANTSMELELLKSQLNPHFFFNALSSLSAVVRENPQKAQQYIFHLSQIFRYSLHKPQQSLVSLKEELQELNSYVELMIMRHENGFALNVLIDTKDYLLQLPHMTLQPLIENALKHNIATANEPLTVTIKMEDHFLIVYNNLQLKKYPEQSTGLGLSNLNERCRILLQKEIEIVKIDNYFTIKIPVK